MIEFFLQVYHNNILKRKYIYIKTSSIQHFRLKIQFTIVSFCIHLSFFLTTNPSNYQHMFQLYIKDLHSGVKQFIYINQSILGHYQYTPKVCGQLAKIHLIDQLQHGSHWKSIGHMLKGLASCQVFILYLYFNELNKIFLLR